MSHIKYRHRYIHGIGNEQNGYESLEDPFPEDKCLKVRQIVMTDDQIYELVTGNKGKYYTGDRRYHILSKIRYQVKYTRHKI